MFGLFGKKDDKPAFVGAKQKIEQARLKAQSGQFSMSSQKREGSPTVPVVVIFAMCVGIALALTEGPIKTGLGLSVGDSGLSRALFGPGNPTFTGMAETDYGIAVFIRALFIFAVTGSVPWLTKLWQGIFDRARINAYLAMWGTMVGLLLIGFTATGALLPFFRQLGDLLLLFK